MTEAAQRLRPPLLCTECALGLGTAYGPTLRSSPIDIYTRRRSVTEIDAQRTFLREGEIPASIFTLYSGWAYQFKQLSDGRRQILSFLIPGDTIPLEQICAPNRPLPYSVKSLTPLSVCVFDLSSIAETVHATEEQRGHMAGIMADQFMGMHRRLTDLGRRSALGRVAQLILELEQRLRNRQMSERGVFPFPVRQEHIADALGLTTVYVNRVLDRLRQDGVIEFNRSQMTVLDMARLQQIGEEE